MSTTIQSNTPETAIRLEGDDLLAARRVVRSAIVCQVGTWEDDDLGFESLDALRGLSELVSGPVGTVERPCPDPWHDGWLTTSQAKTLAGAAEWEVILGEDLGTNYGHTNQAELDRAADARRVIAALGRL